MDKVGTRDGGDMTPQIQSVRVQAPRLRTSALRGKWASTKSSCNDCDVDESH